MQNKQKITLIIIGAAVIVILLVVFLWPREKTGPLTNSPANSPTGQSATMAPVPANVVVPNEGDKNVQSGVAAPQIQAPAHPSGGSASIRQFAITVGSNAENNGVFNPATVIAKKGDIVDLEITAADKDYDFTQPDYGFPAVPLPKGATTRIQFQALSVGKFTFYCTACGGPSKGPVGYIIITN